MSKVVIYTAGHCPYCHRAKELLRTKGVAYDEIDVSGQPKAREDLRIKSGGRNTVPQIWIGVTHVGGCDDLHALNSAGKLDPLLNAG